MLRLATSRDGVDSPRANHKVTVVPEAGSMCNCFRRAGNKRIEKATQLFTQSPSCCLRTSDDNTMLTSALYS